MLGLKIKLCVREQKGLEIGVKSLGITCQVKSDRPGPQMKVSVHSLSAHLSQEYPGNASETLQDTEKAF